MKPAPQTPHLVSPEKRYRGRFADESLPVVVIACRVCFCRSFAADQSSSGMIRRGGTAVVIHSDAGFSRDTRLPVSGFFTYRKRFHTMRPTYSSLFRIPVPRFAFPYRVLGLHLPPNGPATPCWFNVFAIRFGDCPDTNSRKIRSTIAASVGSISRSPVDTVGSGHRAHGLDSRNRARRRPCRLPRVRAAPGASSPPGPSGTARSSFP